MDDAEADVFLLMMEMLRPDSKLDMAGMWKERIPKLKLRIYQLDRLLRWTYPHLHAHFTAIELSPEVITAQWFLTLFTYTFPVVPTVLELWDYIFLTGWEGMFKVALSLLGSLQPKLLELDDFESIVMLMREWKREGKLIIEEPIHALLSRADKFIINKEVLDRLQESFASEILSIALIRSQLLTTEREAQQQQQQQQGSGGGSGSASPTPRTGLSAAFHARFPGLSGGRRLADDSANNANNNSYSNSSGNTNDSNSNINSNNIDNNNSSSKNSGSTGELYHSGLASLSNTERRKVIQKQQQQEAEIEEQLLSGNEAPVFWLLRYGAKLPEKVLMELRRIKIDLIALDHQVDVDKQLIQAKIIRACEMSRETQDEVAAAEQALQEATATVEQGKTSLQAALTLARQVALDVVELMEGPSVSPTSPYFYHPNGQGGTGEISSEPSPDQSRSNSSAVGSSGLALLTEQVASFGSYQNKLSKGGLRSQTNSRTNSSDVFYGDSISSGSSSAATTATASSSSGLRFPSLLTGSWSTLRRDRSIKKSEPSPTASINATASTQQGTAALSLSSPILQAELEVARSFIYDEDANKDGEEDPIAAHDAFSGEKDERPRVRSFGVARETVTFDLAQTEFDDTERFTERLNIAVEDLEESCILSDSTPSATDGGSAVTGTGTRVNTALASPSINLAESSCKGGWNFPVVRAFHGLAIGSNKQATSAVETTSPTRVAPSAQPPSAVTAAASGGGVVHMAPMPVKMSAKAHSRQMKSLEHHGQWVQQQIIDIDRALEDAKRDLEFARRRLQQARESNEETVLWKNSLCDQLHLLVRDSNRGRSQKLMYVAENYNI